MGKFHQITRNSFNSKKSFKIFSVYPNAYKSNPSKRALHPADEALLEDDRTAKDTARSTLHNQATNIFRRSEIISSKNKHYGKFGQEIIERQLGAGNQIKKVQRKPNQEPQAPVQEYKTRTEQIEVIEKGFEACKDTTSEKYQKHHHKKDVYATEFMPIFPDFETWKHPCKLILKLFYSEILIFLICRLSSSIRHQPSASLRNIIHLYRRRAIASNDSRYGRRGRRPVCSLFHADPRNSGKTQHGSTGLRSL